MKQRSRFVYECVCVVGSIDYEHANTKYTTPEFISYVKIFFTSFIIYKIIKIKLITEGNV